jgi:hypothetical protein
MEFHLFTLNHGKSCPVRTKLRTKEGRGVTFTRTTLYIPAIKKLKKIESFLAALSKDNLISKL